MLCRRLTGFLVFCLNLGPPQAADCLPCRTKWEKQAHHSCVSLGVQRPEVNLVGWGRTAAVGGQGSRRI